MLCKAYGKGVQASEQDTIVSTVGICKRAGVCAVPYNTMQCSAAHAHTGSWIQYRG